MMKDGASRICTGVGLRIVGSAARWTEETSRGWRSRADASEPHSTAEKRSSRERAYGNRILLEISAGRGFRAIRSLAQTPVRTHDSGIEGNSRALSLHRSIAFLTCSRRAGRGQSVAAIALNTRAQGLLYRKTRNRVEVFAPSESTDYRIEASTGKTVDGNRITLSPPGDQVVLRVYAGDRYLGKKTFAVVDPPLPTLEVFNDSGDQLLCGEGVPRDRPGLRFQLAPDSVFAARHPEDATYRVRRVALEMRPTGFDHGGDLGTFELGEEGTLKGRLVRILNNLRAQPGDRFVVRLQKVVRINHNGDAVSVDLSEAASRFEFELY